MKNMTIEAIAAAVEGKYEGPADTAEASSVITDSRKADKDCVFVALPGERVDGHDFIPEVLSKGALCCISEKEIEGCDRVIVVESTAKALRDLAKYYLEQLDIKVVGITGSVGKTSTKEMIASVLSSRFKIHKTAGNFNNEIGLPLTVFGIRDEHEIAVLEMGISDFGEMDRLAEIAKPDVMVITNIGQCHLEQLKNRDGVLKAKTECFEHLKPGALVILNGDDDKLSTIKNVPDATIKFFSKEDEKADAYASEIHLCGVRGVEFKANAGSDSIQIHEPLPGEHNVYNVLAATLVARHFGETGEEIKKGAAKVPVLAGRNHLVVCGDLQVFDDCYNANPASMKSSIDVITQENGRTVAILGDMGELGEDEKALHYEIGEYLAKADLDAVYTVGTLTLETARALRKENPAVSCRSFDVKEDLYPVLKKEIKSGDTILVKASHFMKFEEIVDWFKKEYS